MGDLSFGQIILLMVFVLVPLINFVIKQLKRRVENETPADEPVPETPRRVQATPKVVGPPAPPTLRNEALKEPVTPKPLSRGRFSKRSLLENTRDVRRGIIIMTILEPCRTFDPRD